MAADPFLEVRGLTRSFAGRTVVRNVGFTLDRGRALALVGPSGAGKSTLARLVAQSETPDSGQVLLHGRPPQLARGDIQLIPQQPAASLNPRFTVEQAIEEPLRIQRRGTPATRRREVRRWMETVGLPAALARARTSALSGGECQRVAIARSLVLEPELLILDESLSGLDLSVCAQIATLLLDLRRRRGLTYILISHDLALAAQLADEIAVMDDGAIVEHAAAAELLASPRHARSRELVHATRELSLAGIAGSPLPDGRGSNADPGGTEGAATLSRDRSPQTTLPHGAAGGPSGPVARSDTLPSGTGPGEMAGSLDEWPRQAGGRTSGVRFLAMRLLHGLVLLAAISLFAFLLTQIAGGDFYSELRSDPRISPATIAGLRAQAGMDRPLLVRYGRWLRSSLRGDFGYSLAYQSPVAPLLWERTRATLLLTGTATLLGWLLAVPLGIWSAAHRGTWRDGVARFVLAILLTVPDLLLALALLVFAAQTGWFPVGGKHLALPVTVLVLGLAPALARHARSSLLEAMDSPFALSARAQGIPRRRRLYRHLLPAALNPLISLFGLSVGTLLSASLLVEVVMGWPGLGPLFLEAIMARDFAVVLAVVMLSAVFLIVGNLVGDLLLYRFDPRIRTVDQ